MPEKAGIGINSEKNRWLTLIKESLRVTRTPVTKLQI